MRDLLLTALRDIYAAEQQVLTALPELIRVAKAARLKARLQAHVATTQSHIGRLSEIFEELDEPPEGKVCLAMEGLVNDGQMLGQVGLVPELLDAALVAAAHKIAHYEIAAYGSLCGYAEASGFSGAAKSLRASLADETTFDADLTELAKSHVNPRATGLTAA
jgi:ferritin-like metal-binding protein YciE